MNEKRGKNPAAPDESAEPHAPDVAARETLDEGFSAGWGLHFQPNEDYWLDCHGHLKTGSLAEMFRWLEEWFGALDAYRLDSLIAIVKDPEGFAVCGDLAARDPRFHWICWMPHDRPDLALLRQALAQNALGLKIHNAPIMSGHGDPEVWLTPAWQELFEALGEARRPVLWHVTQRTSVSPYHGGGADAYWREGRAKGIRLTNEDLLRVMQEVVRRHPAVPFIGAHQLHVGLDRLDALLAAHPNLYIDSSCGFFLRWADTLYDRDREALRAFFLRHPDRILFGTDAALGVGRTDAYAVQTFLCHARFVLQLHLPDGVLQRVAHGNAERLFGCEPRNPLRRGNARP